jgi:hypothetical protein
MPLRRNYMLSAFAFRHATPDFPAYVFRWLMPMPLASPLSAITSAARSFSFRQPCRHTPPLRHCRHCVAFMLRLMPALLR